MQISALVNMPSQTRLPIYGRDAGRWACQGDCRDDAQCGVSFETGQKLKHAFLKIACVVCGLIVALCSVPFKLCSRSNAKLPDERW